jgi:hypothetical protein
MRRRAAGYVGILRMTWDDSHRIDHFDEMCVLD